MTKTYLDTILKGLSEPINEPSPKYDDEAMAAYMSERNKPILFPPYTITRFKNKQDEE